MPVTANIHEAKTTLSKLIKRALAGEEVIIAKAGKPLVHLTPIAPPKSVKNRLAIFEQFQGKVIVSENWEDSPFDAEMERRWYGDETESQAHAAETPASFDRQ